MSINRILTATICAAVLVVETRLQVVKADDDLLQRSRTMYGALRSYADTGVVVKEYSASTRDRHTFSTNFNRAPRRFRLDFNKQSGDRYVVWGDPDAFHTWWKTTGQQFD